MKPNYDENEEETREYLMREQWEAEEVKDDTSQAPYLKNNNARVKKVERIGNVRI